MILAGAGVLGSAAETFNAWNTLNSADTGELISDDNPIRTMSNVDVRNWYINQTSDVPELNQQWIEEGVPIEERALRAYEIRHDARIEAREMMSDYNAVGALQQRDVIEYGNPNGPTFEYLIDKAKAKGLTGDDIYNYIIGSSSRTDQTTNDRLNIKKP